MLVRRKTSKKDFDTVAKLLTKVKKLYLVHKARLYPETPLEQLAITDDDQVPLELLDEIVSRQRHKHENKVSLLNELIRHIISE